MRHPGEPTGWSVARSRLRGNVRAVINVMHAVSPVDSSLKSKKRSIKARMRWLRAKADATPAPPRRGATAMNLGEVALDLGERYTELYQRKAAELRQLEDMGATTFEDGTELDVRHQGDRSFYTKSALLARDSISSDSTVKHHISEFWNLLRESDLVGPCNGKEGSVLQHSGFVRFYRLVYKSIVDDFVESEVQESVEADWARESAGTDFLDKNRFDASIFELVDTWVDSIETDHYVAFLELLLHSISGGDPPRRFLLSGENVSCMQERFLNIGSDSIFAANLDGEYGQTKAVPLPLSVITNHEDAEEENGSDTELDAYRDGLLGPAPGWDNFDSSVDAYVDEGENSDSLARGERPSTSPGTSEDRGVPNSARYTRRGSPSPSASPQNSVVSSGSSLLSDKMPAWLVRQSLSLDAAAAEASQAAEAEGERGNIVSLERPPSFLSITQASSGHPPWLVRQQNSHSKAVFDPRPTVHVLRAENATLTQGNATTSSRQKHLSNFRCVMADTRTDRRSPVNICVSPHSSFLESRALTSPHHKVELVPTKLNIHRSLHSREGELRASPELVCWVRDASTNQAVGNRDRTRSRSAPASRQHTPREDKAIGARSEASLLQLSTSLEREFQRSRQEPLVVRSPSVAQRVTMTPIGVAAKRVVSSAVRRVQESSPTVDCAGPKTPPSHPSKSQQQATYLPRLQPKRGLTVPISPSQSVRGTGRRLRTPSPVAPHDLFGRDLARRLRRSPSVPIGIDGTGQLSGAMLCGKRF